MKSRWSPINNNVEDVSHMVTSHGHTPVHIVLEQLWVLDAKGWLGSLHDRCCIGWMSGVKWNQDGHQSTTMSRMSLTRSHPGLWSIRAVLQESILIWADPTSYLIPPSWQQEPCSNLGCVCGPNSSQPCGVLWILFDKKYTASWIYLDNVSDFLPQNIYLNSPELGKVSGWVIVK